MIEVFLNRFVSMNLVFVAVVCLLIGWLLMKAFNRARTIHNEHEFIERTAIRRRTSIPDLFNEAWTFSFPEATSCAKSEEAFNEYLDGMDDPESYIAPSWLRDYLRRQNIVFTPKQNPPA